MNLGMRITCREAGAARRASDHRIPAPNGTPQPAAANSAVSAYASRGAIVVIERRELIRDCLSRALRAAGHEVVALSCLEDWLKICGHTSAAVVVLSCPGQGGADQIRQTMHRLSQAGKPLPTVVLSDSEAPGEVVDALNCGARGYIPTNLSLDVAVEAIRLVNAGGVFVPASCLAEAQSHRRNPAPGAAGRDRVFTARQAAVVEAIRRGKANKIIAYELNLRESTVKVHIRNIMRKLKAKNRTEVAYIANNLANTGDL